MEITFVFYLFSSVPLLFDNHWLVLFVYECFCFVLFIPFFFRFHIQVKSYSICSDLFHLAQYSLGPNMLSHMMRFHSLLQVLQVSLWIRKQDGLALQANVYNYNSNITVVCVVGDIWWKNIPYPMYPHSQLTFLKACQPVSRKGDGSDGLTGTRWPEYNVFMSYAVVHTQVSQLT